MDGETWDFSEEDFLIFLEPAKSNPEELKEGKWNVYVREKNDPNTKTYKAKDFTYKRALKSVEDQTRVFKGQKSYPKDHPSRK